MTTPRRPTAAERLVLIGAATIFGSMLLPWYGIPFSSLAVTGFDAFGLAAAALLLTAAAAVVVAMREASGRPPARPLRSAELVFLAGAWATLIAVYLFFDRPDELAGSRDVSARLGVYVAFGGGLAIALAGMRMRAERRATAAR